MDRPAVLEDITVIEVTRSIGGALCGRLLTELGADVILLEPPDGHALRELDGDGHLFEAVAAGKRSVGIASLLETTATDLIGDADVIVTDEHGWADHLADHPAIHHNPAVVYCTVTPFGTGGPNADRDDPDPVVQALSGLTATSGFPGSLPAVSGVPITETLGAFIGTGAILANLFAGSNGTIDVSNQDAALPLLTTFLPAFFDGGDSIEPPGNHHPNVAPWNAYRAKDDWVFFIALTDREWSRFLELIGREELRDDPRFSSTQRRRQNVSLIDEIVTEWIARHTVDEVLERADTYGLTAAPIQTVAEAFENENLRERNMSVESAGLPIAGSVFAMSETPGRVSSPAPKRPGQTEDDS